MSTRARTHKRRKRNRGRAAKKRKLNDNAVVDENAENNTDSSVPPVSNQSDASDVANTENEDANIPREKKTDDDEQETDNDGSDTVNDSEEKDIQETSPCGQKNNKKKKKGKKQKEIFDESMLERLVQAGIDYQYFTSGDQYGHIKAMKEDIPELTKKQIRTKLKWLNRKCARIQVAMNLDTNKTKKGEYKKHFKRQAAFKNAGTAWYKLWLEQVGADVEETTEPVSSTDAAVARSKNGGTSEQKRRRQKAKSLNAKKNHERACLISTTDRNMEQTKFFKGLNDRQRNKEVGRCRYAITQAFGIATTQEKELLKRFKEKLTSGDEQNYVSQVASSLEYVPADSLAHYLLDMLEMDEKQSLNSRGNSNNSNNNSNNN